MANIENTLARRHQLTLADINMQARREETAARVQQQRMAQQAQMQQAAMAVRSRDRAIAAQMADAEANRRYQMQLNRERLATSLQQQREAISAQSAADQRRLAEAGRQSDAALWEQGQNRVERGYEFDASRYDAAYNADANRQLQSRNLDEQAYQFDAVQGERARQFDMNRQLEIGTRQFEADRQQASQERGYQQQRDMAVMQAGIHDWMQTQDLTRSEQMRLNRMQQSVAEIANDPKLADWEQAAMITQLKTGIDPLLNRQRQMLMRQEEQRAALLQKQAAHEEAILQENANFRAKTFDQRVSAVRNPDTGQNEYWLDMGPQKPPQRVFEDQGGVDSVKVMTDWVGKYMETHENPDGTPVTAAQAKQIYRQIVDETRRQPNQGAKGTQRQAVYPSDWPEGSRTLPEMGSPDQGAYPTQRPTQAPISTKLAEQRRQQQEKVKAESEKRSEARKDFMAKRVDYHIGKIVEARLKARPDESPDYDDARDMAVKHAQADMDAMIEHGGSDQEKLEMYRRQKEQLGRLRTQMRADGADQSELDKINDRYAGVSQKIVELQKKSPQDDEPGESPTAQREQTINRYVASAGGAEGTQAQGARGTQQSPAPQQAADRLVQIQQLASTDGDNDTAFAAKQLAQLLANNGGSVASMSEVDRHWAKQYLARIENYVQRRKARQ